mgnify:CR=1 FL=1|jgi:hypothetical protein|tara:strand:+ start:1435 stop:2079 length:645 start_codon:yes stop_codon:yes gene_type:complete
MKLITEVNEDVEFVVEKRGDVREHFIHGVFMQGGVKNKNGRVYPMENLGEAIAKYNNEYVSKSRALGELNHPEGPTVNLDKVSHMIKELRQDGNNFVGKAKVLNTPMGKIVKGLLDEGTSLGVSSRGMGSLKKTNRGINEVQNDFILSAVDIVADPSAPDAFVNGILEGKEWVWDNGLLKEQQIANYEKQIKRTSSRKLEEKTLKLFKDFLSNL